ncbi:MAG: stage II sporulation protein P [Oscillospiraceae bacterium]|jgi:stage II sporulation protein P|nr:stage II sporulation protein P [Oscillospiraceae bacterium]
MKRRNPKPRAGQYAYERQGGLSAKKPVRMRPFAAGSAALLSLLVAVRILSAAGSALGASSLFSELVGQESGAVRLLDFELGAAVLPRGADAAAWLLGKAYGADAAALNAAQPNAEAAGAASSETPGTPAETRLPPSVPTPDFEIVASPTPDAPLFYNSAQLGPPGNADRGVDNARPLSADGINVRNSSGLELDVAALLSEPLETRVAPSEPSVLIIHTHSSEAFTPEPPDEYEPSDPYRTEDKAHSIIRVGDVLAESLAARGLVVLHDRGVYDYPSYTGSYGRTLDAVAAYLLEYPTITLVIDLHRDAMETADGSQFKTIADINGDRCSQVMLVVGTNGSGLEHPAWRENMKLALRLEYEMNRAYPTLARPITVSQFRYNQHLTPGALIVEIGATGNTLAESERAARYFAEAYANVALG